MLAHDRKAVHSNGLPWMVTVFLKRKRHYLKFLTFQKQQATSSRHLGHQGPETSP